MWLRPKHAKIAVKEKHQQKRSAWFREKSLINDSYFCGESCKKRYLSLDQVIELNETDKLLGTWNLLFFLFFPISFLCQPWITSAAQLNKSFCTLPAVTAMSQEVWYVTFWFMPSEVVAVVWHMQRKRCYLLCGGTIGKKLRLEVDLKFLKFISLLPFRVLFSIATLTIALVRLWTVASFAGLSGKQKTRLGVLTGCVSAGEKNSHQS